MLRALVLTALALSPVARAPRSEDDASKLLEGVETVAKTGIPGPVAVFGESSFAVVAGGLDGSLRAAAIAAGKLGSGRVVAFGHNGYMSAAPMKTGETKLVMRALLQWAARTKMKTPRVGALGGAFADVLKELGCEVVDVPRGAKPDGVDRLALIGCAPLSLNEEEAKWLSAYVNAGGAVFCGDTPWGWHQGNADKAIDTQPGQQLLAAAGLAYCDGYLGATAPDDRFVGAMPSPLLNASHALDALLAVDAGKRQLSKEELAQAVSSLQLTLRWIPEGDFAFRRDLERLVKERGSEIVPTEAHPIGNNDALRRALLSVQIEQLRRTPVAKLRAHPAALDFPGDVEAPAFAQTLDIDSSVPGWHSTGWYARPGARIEFTVPSEAVARGFLLRIGCHADTLWHTQEWKRVPEITREFAVDAATIIAVNPFGGPIYVVAPEGCTLGRIRVRERGAILAPRFVLGETTLEDWRASLRARPAPWAEIESKKLVISVPSSVVRGLEDPEALMKFWDRVLDAQAKLASIPLERARPERFVCDRQISAGYMHSGYPIMMHLDVQRTVVSLEQLVDGEHMWGFVHELGHNLQQGDWTFEGTGEVTNNLFAAYAIEVCCELAEGKHGHGAVDVPPSFEAYVERGASFDEWKREPFLALEMYMQVQREFGWDVLRKTFAEYRRLNMAERPKDDAAKRDQWLVRLSRVCGRDLGAFFESWGVPTSEAARKSLSDLTAWGGK